MGIGRTDSCFAPVQTFGYVPEQPWRLLVWLVLVPKCGDALRSGSEHFTTQSFEFAFAVRTSGASFLLRHLRPALLHLRTDPRVNPSVPSRCGTENL